jgi:cytochrome P450
MVEKKIPGPAELPWLGSIVSFAKNPASFLLEMSMNYGPVARFSVFNMPLVVVSDPALIRAVLVERADEFPKSPRDLAILSPYLGEGLLTSLGASHRQRRKLVQPAFHHKRIQDYGEIMVSYTEEMLAKWQAGDVRDISEEMMRLTLFIVAKSLFKEDTAQMAHLADQLGESTRELQDVVDRDFQSPIPPSLSWYVPGSKRRRELQRALHEIFDGIIDTRLRAAEDGTGDGVVEDRGDLLSMLLLSQDEEGKGLSRAEIRDEVTTILLAGHETTSNALTWTFYLLGKHPMVAAKLFTEVDSVLAGRAPTLADLPKLTYTAQILKESMRLYPPAWMLNARHVPRNTELGGYLLPAGTDIFVSPYVMHHQPHYFESPTEFRPERFTPEFEEGLPRFAYMPFGGGPRICIGNSFAMMEAQLILATISQCVALQLAPDKVAEMNPQITMSVKGGLTMRVVPRQAQYSGVSEAMPQGELVAAG